MFGFFLTIVKSARRAEKTVEIERLKDSKIVDRTGVYVRESGVLYRKSKGW
jgi:hypothetical protein